MSLPLLIYVQPVFPFQTIGAAFGAKKVSVQGESVTLGIWVCSLTLDRMILWGGTDIVDHV